MKEIKDYPNYKVTEEGEVWSFAQNEPKKLTPRKTTQSKKKYLQVSLYNKDTKKHPKTKQKLPKQRYIHHLVWEAYRGPIGDNMEIDHIDNNPSNNHIDNLQLVTREDNMLKWNRIRYGVLSRDMVKEIRDLENQGFKVHEIADKLGKSYTAIYRVVNNKKQRYKTIKGKRHYYLIDYDYDKLV